MNKSNKLSPVIQEQTVRMVQEYRWKHPSLWAAVESMAPKIGCVPQTLLEWVKRAEVDAGARPGTTTAEMQRIKDLESENKELRRANEILRTTSVFFFAQAELDRKLKFVNACIDQHRDAYGVESIWEASLQVCSAGKVWKQ